MTNSSEQPIGRASPRRDALAGLAGFVLAIGVAVALVSGCVVVISNPDAWHGCRVLAIILGGTVGLSQGLYGFPLYAWARRSESSFCAGLLAGAAVVLVINIVFGALMAFFPSFND